MDEKQKRTDSTNIPCVYFIEFLAEHHSRGDLEKILDQRRVFGKERESCLKCFDDHRKMMEGNYAAV